MISELCLGLKMREASGEMDNDSALLVGACLEMLHTFSFGTANMTARP